MILLKFFACFKLITQVIFKNLTSFVSVVGFSPSVSRDEYFSVSLTMKFKCWSRTFFRFSSRRMFCLYSTSYQNNNMSLVSCDINSLFMACEMINHLFDVSPEISNPFGDEWSHFAEPLLFFFLGFGSRCSFFLKMFHHHSTNLEKPMIQNSNFKIEKNYPVVNS